MFAAANATASIEAAKRRVVAGMVFMQVLEDALVMHRC
jgi:hypothetical protein